MTPQVVLTMTAKAARYLDNIGKTSRTENEKGCLSERGPVNLADVYRQGTVLYCTSTVLSLDIALRVDA